jgi:hypothetical protein
MFRRSIVRLPFLLCALVVFGAAAAKNTPQQASHPNLSGIWKLDKSQGNYVKLSGLNPDADFVLVISHAEPEIKVLSKISNKQQQRIENFTYYTDGRGEVSHTYIENLEGKSKSKWDKERLSTTFSVDPSDSRISVGVTQVWTLAKDGTTLTQSQRLAGPGVFGDTEVKRVFHRIP